ncbi:hypothetical protein QBC38DRAFT_469709 [Podospora fimiseda]|uniref:Uncharacterized protein n=1 Tax=Podospora fimiseda TaxID=252190 RepID=A0AAN7BV75_9PEZI|nr:hypothetical protein QBC38DRAFT_469709 [Podospora fimiseda]
MYGYKSKICHSTRLLKPCKKGELRYVLFFFVSCLFPASLGYSSGTVQVQYMCIALVYHTMSSSSVSLYLPSFMIYADLYRLHETQEKYYFSNLDIFLAEEKMNVAHSATHINLQLIPGFPRFQREFIILPNNPIN